MKFLKNKLDEKKELNDFFVFIGGPLVCPVAGHSGHYYQAGIVAWGIGTIMIFVFDLFVMVQFLHRLRRAGNTRSLC